MDLTRTGTVSKKLRFGNPASDNVDCAWKVFMVLDVEEQGDQAVPAKQGMCFRPILFRNELPELQGESQAWPSPASLPAACKTESSGTP